MNMIKVSKREDSDHASDGLKKEEDQYVQMCMYNHDMKRFGGFQTIQITCFHQ
jgi:hypothetical protein